MHKLSVINSIWPKVFRICLNAIITYLLSSMKRFIRLKMRKKILLTRNLRQFMNKKINKTAGRKNSKASKR